MITIVTRQGSPLVESDQSHEMQTVASSDGQNLRVILDDSDITSEIQSGEMGGALAIRDQVLPSYLKQLDDMADSLITEVNAQHKLGSDYSGAQGGNFFLELGSKEGAAKSLALAISKPTQIAAASLGAGPGSNSNALAMADLSGKKMAALNGSSLGDYYANLVFTVGSDNRSAGDGLQTQNAVLVQLQNQRDSFSGVSLDEEATNILRYQKAYEGAARFMQVVSSLTDEILQLVGG